MNLNLKASQRISVLGRSGSGKTTFLKELIRAISYIAFVVENWSPYHIIILDTKKDDDFKGMGKKFTRLKELSKLWQAQKILIYEPISEEMNEQYYNGLIKFLRDTEEPFLLVIDELSSLLKNGRAVEQYDLLMKQGRGKCQVVWAGIQNPVFIPPDFLRNADHYFVFDLLDIHDRERLRGICGAGIMNPPADEHGFNHFEAGKKRLTYYSNEPPISFGIPDNYIKLIGQEVDEGKEGKGMNWKLIIGLLFLGLAMVFIIPLWKVVFAAAGNAVPAVKPVTDIATQA